jgi:predicted MFS family arabinose efflux permease
MAFSVAHIFGHNAGMQITAAYGFTTTWLFFGILAAIAWVLLIWVRRLVAKESEAQNVSLSPKLDK